MHFNGRDYQLEYRAARREPEFQVRITAPEVVAADQAAELEFRANVFNAMPDAKVEWRFLEGSDNDWKPMTKISEPDPTYQVLWDEEQKLDVNNPPWRKLAKPLMCPHL